jgi:hypothetical protein
MAGVVDLLVAGGDGVTAAVLPLQAMGGEDPERGAALAAYREGLLVPGDLAGRRGGRGELLI